MPKHPEITIKIINNKDATLIILQCLDALLNSGKKNEAKMFLTDIRKVGLMPAIYTWFNIERETLK